MTLCSLIHKYTLSTCLSAGQHCYFDLSKDTNIAVTHDLLYTRRTVSSLTIDLQWSSSVFVCSFVCLHVGEKERAWPCSLLLLQSLSAGLSHPLTLLIPLHLSKSPVPYSHCSLLIKNFHLENKQHKTKCFLHIRAQYRRQTKSKSKETDDCKWFFYSPLCL